MSTGLIATAGSSHHLSGFCHERFVDRRHRIEMVQGMLEKANLSGAADAGTDL